MITGSHSQRFGDTPLSFSMSRYTSDKDRPAKWFFGVSRYIGRENLIEVEVTPDMLRDMARWIEKAKADLATDGGRNPATGAA